MKEILLTVSLLSSSLTSSSFGRSSLTTFLIFLSGLHFFGSEGKEGQAELRCPDWPQWKQRLFLIQHSHSSGVILVIHMTSTSMVLESLAGLGGEGAW